MALATLITACPRPGTTHPPPETAAPATAAPVEDRPPNLARAKLLLTPYDPAGASREAIQILLRLARNGDKEAYAALARTYIDWTAYAAYAGDAPLLTLLLSDLGVEVGPGAPLFPLPAAYVERLRKLAKAGGLAAETESLLAAWEHHDLSSTYWKRMTSASGGAAYLWALMDCEGSLRSASRLPSGLAAWYFVKGCAARGPDVLSTLLDRDAEGRSEVLRALLGCTDPTAAAGDLHGCEVALDWPADRLAYFNAQTAAVVVGLSSIASLRAAFEATRGALRPFSRDALERSAGSSSLPGSVAFVAVAAGPGVPEIPHTSYGLHDDRSRLLVTLTPKEVRITAKPVVGLDEKTARPTVDLGPASPYPGEVVALGALAARLAMHARAWEERGLGTPLPGMPVDPHARALSLAIDRGVRLSRVGKVVSATWVAGVRAFFALARRWDGSVTEVPTRIELLPGSARPPAPPFLELTLGKRKATLVYHHGPGSIRRVVAHREKGGPDLRALYSSTTEILEATDSLHSRPPLRVWGAKGATFGDLFDAVDALRHRVPGAPFPTAEAFDESRRHTDTPETGPGAGLPKREMLVGSITWLLRR